MNGDVFKYILCNYLEFEEMTDIKGEGQDLPFYLSDYDELKSRFVTFRLQGNLRYSDIISGICC